MTGAHPAWDEWIEIYRAMNIKELTFGLIPLGMSGLKLAEEYKSDDGERGLIPLGMSGLKCFLIFKVLIEHWLIPLGMSGLK